jgi:ribosomal protein S18 acetylase RimI-like enzyme
MHALAQDLDNLTIRNANAGDQDFLIRLYASTRDDLRQIAADPAFADSLIAMQQNMQAASYRSRYPDAEYLLLEHHGDAVGRMIVDTGPEEIRLIDISFMPHSRGKGFGTAVLRSLQQCAARKAMPLRLSVHRNNVRARRLYAALGFRVESGDEMAEQMLWTRPASPTW